MMELDHIFIRATPGAPEASALADFGLAEGSGNRHPGQGTANRRFFFANAFIELLWLDDAAEAQGEAVRPTRLYERLSARDAAVSPFGICLRPSPGDTATFHGWRYQPAYFPPGVACTIAPAPLAEPMWFHLAPGGRPDALPPERAQPLEHRVPLKEITGVTLVQPHSVEMAGMPVVARQGPQHLLEIEFDHGAQGKSHDFRPVLPLMFAY